MKEDLTIWHIHGLELPLDIEEADTVEKYEAALAQLEQDMPEDKSAGAAAYIRHTARRFVPFMTRSLARVRRSRSLPGSRTMHGSIPQCTAISDLCGKTGGTVPGGSIQLKKKYLPKGGRR